jgi:hypothetical protein
MIHIMLASNAPPGALPPLKPARSRRAVRGSRRVVAGSGPRRLRPSPRTFAPSAASACRWPNVRP